MRIGEVAAATGLEASAIRFYEDQGVVPAPQRTAAGYRSYSPAEVELLTFVRRLRALRLPLDDVREIVGMRTDGTAPCTAVRAAIAREAAAVDRRIADLERVRAELGRLQEQAAGIADDWPGPCVCHVIEGA